MFPKEGLRLPFLGYKVEDGIFEQVIGTKYAV